jgi:hypothetical protein
LRFALYKSVEKKDTDRNDKDENKDDESSNKPTFEINIFKRMKTIYDVKFLKLDELEENSVELNLINNNDAQYA